MPDQLEQAGGQQHAGKVENDVIGVKAAAENGLDQLIESSLSNGTTKEE